MRRRIIAGMDRKFLVPSRPLTARDDLVSQVLFGCPLPALAERLLLRLLHLANSNGNCDDASLAALALSLRVSERAVRNALRTLEQQGLIATQRPRYPQSGDSSTYHVSKDRIRALADDWRRASAGVTDIDPWTKGSAQRFLGQARAGRRIDLPADD